MKTVALWLFALASIATGVINLVWHDFERAHEPLQAITDAFPASAFITGFSLVFAIAVALVLVGAGIGLLREASRRPAALALIVVYVLFAVFWLPRLYWAPKYAGAHASVFIGVLVGVGQQLILAAAAALLYDAARTGRIARWTFALCSIDFGLNHLLNSGPALPYVPAYLPFGQHFWVMFTGVAFVLAGIAIACGVADVLAARLLGLMLLIFSAVTLGPFLAQFPNNHVTWGANAYNLTAVAAAWMLAEALAAVQARSSFPLQFGQRKSIAEAHASQNVQS